MNYGKQFSELLELMESSVIEFDTNVNDKPNYSSSALRAAGKIMISVLMDKMWDLQKAENMAMPERIAMADKFGKEFRQLIKTYTGVDSFDFYKTTIVTNDGIIFNDKTFNP